MTRQQIISEVKKYFKINELVCDHIFNAKRDGAWNFLDTDYLHALLVIRRDILAAPMVCNNGVSTQRGMRCNKCDIVRRKTNVYISAHILGKAGDFTVSGMTAEEARRKIKASAALLPCPIRIEKDVDWLHFDVRSQDGYSCKVYEFKG